MTTPPIPATVVSGPEGTLATAIENAVLPPPGEPELSVPTRLFTSIESPARTYMTRDGQRSEALDEADVAEDEKEEGDTDSIQGNERAEELESASEEAFWERVAVLVNKEDGVENSILAKSELELQKQVGNPTKLRYPQPPDDWKPTETKREQGEPPFEDVDNPGKWCQFTFRPKFTKPAKKGEKGKYSGHELPTGARPVPKKKESVRESNGWLFMYHDP